jgi:hypothetical protein
MKSEKTHKTVVKKAEPKREIKNAATHTAHAAVHTIEKKKPAIKW